MKIRSLILASGCRRVGLAALALALAIAGGATAQEPPDSLAARVDRLTALVDSLASELAALRASRQGAEEEDAIARLRAAAQAAARGGGGPPEPATEPEFVGRQRSLQALNPEISLNADVFGHLNQDDVNEDNFVPREFEISLISNLDPFSRAKVFLAYHTPGAELSPFGEEEVPGEEHEGGFAVEEGYAEWVSMPGGLGLKLGRFQQSFGTLNRWHSHALPFQTRSLPHLAFLGEEALAQTGASVHWLVPYGGSAGTYEVTVEVTRSSNESLFGESGRASVLGHLNGFWNLSEAFDLDLGLSWINGSYEDEVNFFDRNLYGAEMALTWRPPGRTLYRGFQLRGGVMALDGLVPPEGQASPSGDRALGLWGAGELRMGQQWLVGARFDRTESPRDPDQTAWLLSPTLTWWQSEWVRLRAEYDLLGRSIQTGREGRFLVQVTFAMGPHKHETY